MIEFPQVQDDDTDREPVISIVSLMLGLLIVAMLVAAIGFGAGYFLKGVGLAAVLPWQRDYGTKDRRRWINKNDDATRVEWALLKTCVVALVLVVVYAVVMVGVPA